LIPVPLHPERLAERGYNQSALLARRVGTLRGLPIQFEHLRRTRATKAQAQLGYRARRTNAESAFHFSGDAGQAAYVLVDDVVTTGHTVDACKAALERTGAIVVGVLAAATGGGLTQL
jgi:predicted amidophosphoribosyltransferase